jgi:hypothetical protein
MDNYLILTVFNLPNKDGLKIINSDSLYEGNPCWMERRLNLYYKYTLPSLLSQTNKEFYSILLCDPETPSPYKEQLLDLEKKYDFIKICWINNRNEYEKYIDVYKQIRKNNSDELYITICDNDDLIHKQYVEIAKEFYTQIPEEYNVICYANGIFWDIETGNFLNSYFPTNSFFTIKTNLNKFTNIININHHSVVNENKSTLIPLQSPMWIQLVHGENLWNKLDRMPGEICQFNINDLKEHFGF